MPERERPKSPIGDHLSEEEKQKLYEISNSPSPERQPAAPSPEVTESQAELSPEERMEVDKDEQQARAKAELIPPAATPTPESEQIGTPTSPSVEAEETPPPAIEQKPTIKEEKIETGKITPEIIKETALKVHEVFRDAKDSGISDQEATIKAKEKLNELTQNNPELKKQVLIEFKETAKINQQQKPESTGPENLPTPRAVEEPAQSPVLKASSESPTETEEERKARSEQDMIAQHLAERRERETAPLPPIEKRLSEEKSSEAEPRETENKEERRERVVKLASEAYERSRNAKEDNSLSLKTAAEIIKSEITDVNEQRSVLKKVLWWVQDETINSLIPPTGEPTEEDLDPVEAEMLRLMAEETHLSEPEATPEETESAAPAEIFEISAEDIELVAKIDKPEDVERLPQEIKEKLGLGFSNLGFFVEENKNKFFAKVFEKASGKMDKQGTLGRFVFSLAENFRRDEENAKKKFEAAKQGQKQRLSNVGYLTGNIMKYGRIAADFAGWTIASPLRYVTLSAMLFGRGAEAAKEARLKNEELIEKNRLDAQAAIEEGWKVYEMAQAKVGDREVRVEELKKAYLENLPEDIENRLRAKYDLEEKTGLTTAVARGMLEAFIDFATTRLQDKLYKIEKNEKLSAQEKEQEKENLLNKYSKKLHDYDRMISQYGTVDALAMGARYAETLSKGVVYGVMLESAYIGLSKLWENLSGVLGENHVTNPLSDLKLRNAYEAKIGVDSHDGLTVEEAKKIQEFTIKSQDPLIQDVMEQYRDMPLKDGHGKVLDVWEGRVKVGWPEETAPEMETEAEPLISVSETKPSAPQYFESILPDLNKAETVHEGGNVWNTTRDIFLYRSPEKLKELGFDVPRADPEFGEKLSHWADAKTAELLNQYAHEHGGHMPDVVHEGDKVIVEEIDGKLHLKVLDSHGNELLEEQAAPSAEIKPEQPPMSDEEMKGLEEKLPAPQHIEAPTVIETPKIPLTELVEKLKETESLIQDKETKITNAVKEYVAETINSEKYAGLKIDGKKLNTFAHMFPMKGVAESVESIDTPEELAKAIELFNNKLHLATETLIKGGMKGLTSKDSPFPVESMDGARIYFAQPLGGNEWVLKKFDQTGQNYQGIQNPFKRFWARDKLKFELKDVIKILKTKI